MRLAAIILVRTDSARFPHKCFGLLGDHSLIEWPILALKKAGISPILATTNRLVDEPLVDLAKQHGVQYFRGDVENVSKRYAMCLEEFQLDYSIRVNGDSPFINIPLLKKSLSFLDENNYDLVSNIITRSYPYGLSVEIINTNSFKKSLSLFDENQREHITQFFYDNIVDFDVKELPLLADNFQQLRMVVDYKSDLLFLNKFLLSTTIEDVNNVNIETLIAEFEKIKILDSK